MDQSKITAVSEWPTRRRVQDPQRFLDIANGIVMVSAPLQATSPQCYKNSLKKPKSNTVAERAFT